MNANYLSRIVNGPMTVVYHELSDKTANNHMLVNLSVGPKSAGLRLTPTTRGFEQMLDAKFGRGYPNIFLTQNPPWHPLDLLLANRGVGGVTPDTSRFHEYQTQTLEGYIRLVTTTMGWQAKQTWVVYHLLTAFHTNATILEDACVTIRQGLYEALGFTRGDADRSLRTAREEYTYPRFRINFWGGDVYGEVQL